MTLDLSLTLALAATVLTGLLAGACLDKALIQLPARRRIGAVAFAAFSRANDLGNGLVVYPLLGIGAALLSILAALAALFNQSPLTQPWPIYVAALLALAHTVMTIWTAPVMLSLRQPIDDEAALAATLDRFAARHTVRTVFVVLNFLFLILAMVVY